MMHVNLKSARQAAAALGLVAMVGTVPAYAADVVQEEPPAPAPVAELPVASWAGPYAGVNIGYGFSGRVEEPGNTINTDGFLGGAFVGYNYQMGQFVLGLEADIQGADLGSGSSIYGVGVKTDYFGTVRARAGVAFDRFMPYITGGWAYGNVKTSIPVIGASAPKRFLKAETNFFA